MKARCTACGGYFTVNDDFADCLSQCQCPHCGATGAHEQVQVKRPSSFGSYPVEPEVNTTLCFFLGLCFNVIGLLIAAIIGKQKGCVCGLWGMLTADAIGAGWWFAMNYL